MAPGRPLQRAGVLALACSILMAAMLPLAAASTASAAAAVPRPKALPAQIDPFAGYDGQRICSPAPKAGALKLARLLKATYGGFAVEISRPCSDGGRSEHKEGRALDWMVSSRVPAQKARAVAFLSWLLKPGADGQPAEMARRLGVMYIGWNNMMWRAYGTPGWGDLKGCSTDPRRKAAGYDTYCHRNHVHLSLSWDGASALTSYWTGHALAAPCTAGWGSGAGWGATGGSPAGVGTDLTLVTPVRALDTRTGLGLGAPCRLTAGEGWQGASRDVVAHVTGIGAVPADGVAAVAVRVTAYRTSAPLPTVSVRTTAGSSLRPVTTSLSSAAYSSTTVVPVADDGTIRLALDSGSADVQVDVVGWVPLVAPVTPPAPGPGPTPTDPVSDPGPTDSGSPVDAAAAAGAVDAAGGRTHVVRSTLVATVHLGAHASDTVELAGVGPIPASGLGGLALTMVSDRTARSTSIGALVGAQRSRVGSLRSSTLVPRATQVLAATTDGRVVLANTGTATAVVRLYVDAWFSADAVTGGATMTMLSSPVKVVDTLARMRLSGAFASRSARTVGLSGVSGVPTGARAALVEVSVLGGGTDATMLVGSAGTVQAVSTLHRQWAHEVVLLPLAASGVIALRTTSIGSQARVWLLGFVA